MCSIAALPKHESEGSQLQEYQPVGYFVELNERRPRISFEKNSSASRGRSCHQIVAHSIRAVQSVEVRRRSEAEVETQRSSDS